MVTSSGAQKETAHKHFTLWSTRRVKYLFVLPAVLLILGIAIFPLFYSLGISFTDWSMQSVERSFVGLRNYGQILTEKRWQMAMVHTLGLTGVAVTVELILGFGIAQLLVGELPGKRLIIPILVFPAVTNPITVGFLWKVLYNPAYGPIDQIIGWVIGRKFDLIWLTNPVFALPAITITEIWQWTPFMFLVMLAGLAAINPELFEAASIDGASNWQILTQITIPVMKPIIIVAMLIRGLDVFKMFDLVFAMTSGGPGTASETVSHYIYLLGFKFFRLGYGAAASYLLLIFVSIVATLLVRQFRERE